MSYPKIQPRSEAQPRAADGQKHKWSCVELELVENLSAIRNYWGKITQKERSTISLSTDLRTLGSGTVSKNAMPFCHESTTGCFPPENHGAGLAVTLRYGKLKTTKR
jgi:hypothetical protein